MSDLITLLQEAGMTRTAKKLRRLVLAPVELKHGERFGQLKVLKKLPCGKYRVGCECGFTKDAYRANALMRAGGWTKCSRCRKTESKCK